MLIRFLLYSVRIDVDRLLLDREEERLLASKRTPDDDDKLKSRKRKPDSSEGGAPAKPKRVRTKAHQDAVAPKVTLTVKVPPRTKESLSSSSPFPCCLCVSAEEKGLLRVHDRPLSWSGCTNVVVADDNGVDIWKAHESCVLVMPETWVDEINVVAVAVSREIRKEKIVFSLHL